VLAAGIAKPEEIPECCGVMVVEGDKLVTVRAAPRTEPFVPGISTWMSLAKATPYRSERDRGAML
jgi:sugar (pentulose or hexulose) kinase